MVAFSCLCFFGVPCVPYSMFAHGERHQSLEVYGGVFLGGAGIKRCFCFAMNPDIILKSTSFDMTCQIQ